MVFNYRWTRDEQQKYAEHRLFRFIRNNVYGFHPYYDKVFKEAGISPREINSYRQFGKVPLTEPADFFADPGAFILRKPPESGKPTAAKRLDQVVNAAQGVAAAFRADSLGERRGVREKMAERSFTEWQPVHMQRGGPESPPIAYTLADMQGPVSRLAAMLFMEGIKPGMRLLNLLPCFSTGWLQLLAAQWMVHPPVSVLQAPEGNDAPAAFAEVTGARACEFLLGEPAAVIQWLAAGAEDKAEGGAGLAALRKVMLTQGLDPDRMLEMKKALAQAGAVDAQILQGYGSPEMRALFFECAEGTGIHLNPELFYWEVLHPETREPVKWGEPGVLTFSHFDWHGTVLLRYWTGDLIEGGFYWERCPACDMIMPLAHTPIRRVEATAAETYDQ